MLPTIATGNVGSALAGEYEVANSLRFDDGSSDNLTRTLGTPTSTRKCSISFWVKLSNLSAERSIFEHRFNDGTNKQISLFFSSSDNLQLQLVTGGAYDGRIYSSQLFRDVSAWYHVLIAIDTTLATSGDRLRMYVNGNEVTSFSTELQPSQNYDMHFTSGQTLHIGKNSSSSAYYDGYMAEYVFIDGQQLDPTSFGEFDSDTNIWKPIDVSGLTFGNNGFYLDFENSGSLGADVSGNGNNFTVNNLTSIDQTTDTCTNNFATGNPLIPSTSLSDGNLTISASASVSRTAFSTISVSQGKWYFEMKPSASAGMIGITDISQAVYSNHVGSTSRGYGYNYNGEKYNNGSSSGFGNTFGSGDIIGCAVDLDNNKIYFSKNGTWQNSGDPTSGATGTGSAFDITDGYSYSLAFHAFNGSTTNGNFGNPPFTISSGNSDGNGYGNFEYAVPSGYYAINSKNLAEYG